MSYSPILFFHELRLPYLDGDRAGNWVTNCDDADGMLYLLNGDRNELVDIDEVDMDKLFEELHFPSEPQCHASASAYYLNYNKTYPYMGEWLAAIKHEHRNGNNEPDDTIQSEVMRFE